LTEAADRREWRPFALITCNLFALLLIVAWYSGWSGDFLAPLDHWAFFTFNQTLTWSEPWQYFWAFANTRHFDAGTALVILGLYCWFIFSGAREQMVRRTAVGVVMLVSVVLAIQVSKTFLDGARAGPSVSLEPSIRLSEFVTTFEFKDFSYDSFPGDHGIALIMFTTMIWFFAGRAYGLIMLALSAFMLLPRLVVGAHWLTDHLVGAAFVSLIALSWILATPLHRLAVNWLSAAVDRCYRLAERLLAPLAGGPGQVEPSLKQAPLILGKGFCMGTADIIPGVSGGTMALILGIYERLLNAIRSFDRDWLIDILHFRLSSALARNDLLFLVPLGVGIIAAILFFTRMVPLPMLIVTHPEMVYGLFFGLIVASIVVLMREVDRYGVSQILVTFAGAAAGFAIVNLVPLETPTALWFIFACGFIAISAMLLPGISGSFILLILGKYAYIVEALGTFDLAVIATFMAGAGAGLIVFSRAILWLLERYHQATLLFIKGILIGSLWVIWPFEKRVYETVGDKELLVEATPIWPQSLDTTVATSFALMAAGFIIVMIISRLARRSKPETANSHSESDI